jgi:hypothetical protein
VTPDRVAKDSALAYPVNLSDQELLAREKCRWAELQETPRGVPWHAHVRENWLVLLREVKRRGLVDRIRWDKEWGVVDRIRWDKD